LNTLHENPKSSVVERDNITLARWIQSSILPVVEGIEEARNVPLSSANTMEDGNNTLSSLLVVIIAWR
jgi:hypothetical protein